MKKWTCPLCGESVAYGFTLTSKIITVHREVYLRDESTVCGACLPAEIRELSGALDAGIVKLMQGYGGPYDPTKDLPIVGGIEIVAKWYAQVPTKDAP